MLFGSTAMAMAWPANSAGEATMYKRWMILRRVLVAVSATGMLGLAALPAHADVIERDGAVCRAAPSPTSRMVRKLDRGERVAVLSRRGSWEQVDAGDGARCWIIARATGGAYAPASPAAFRTRHAQGPVSKRSYAHDASHRPSAPHVRRGSLFRPARSSGSCPCNGGPVCVGPRGGRYCITRGGNKRYGV